MQATLFLPFKTVSIEVNEWENWVGGGGVEKLYNYTLLQSAQQVDSLKYNMLKHL